MRGNVNGTWNDYLLTWTEPSLNAWHHLALVRNNTFVYVFVDGSLVGTLSNVNTFGTAGQYLRIGTATMYNENLFIGYIDEVRITKGIARYTTNFTPPSEPFWTPSKTFSRLSSLLVCAPGYNPTENKALRESVPNWEYWDGGDKFIEGTVHYNGNLAQRKVRLYRLIDGQIIRETWSDENGFYRFDRLKDQPYYVWSEDHLRVYDPVSHLVLNQG